MDRNDVLSALLDCGKAELFYLDDMSNDCIDVIYEMERNEEHISFNTFMNRVFDTCVNDFCKAYIEKGDFEDKEKINPLRDFSYCANGLDTYIYGQNEDIYRKYFSDVIDNVEEKIGFKIFWNRVG